MDTLRSDKVCSDSRGVYLLGNLLFSVAPMWGVYPLAAALHLDCTVFLIHVHILCVFRLLSSYSRVK